MIVLVVGLAVSVLYEHTKSVQRDGVSTGHCWQRSISAYYYTPSQSVFVAALVAIGVSLIALKGSTELEDVLLNFAGIFAPVVAFVPTPNAGTCRSVAHITTNRNENIANNITALFVCGGVALAILAADKLIVAGQRRKARAISTQAKRAQATSDPLVGPIAIGGYTAALVLYVAALVAFLGWRRWFTDHAHTLAAITMFLFIFLVVLDNSINFYFTRQAKAQARKHGDVDGAAPAKQPRKFNRYLVIAGLMVLAPLVIGLTGWFGDYKTIWLEATMITLFAAFWVIQTFELWRYGLRTPPRAG
jgi:hypothetical protein